MRLLSLFLSALFAVLLVGRPACAQAQEVSRSPREPGTAVLRELSVAEGLISFRVDSNGCTDAGSFEVRVVREQGITAEVPHYRLTIERVRIDECKAMLWEGVVIELDLEQDLGLIGAYTFSVTNPVLSKQAVGP
jgi:hypothetical protein